MYHKKCQWCGAEFDTWRKGAKYCSRKCVNDSMRNPNTKPRKRYVSDRTKGNVPHTTLFCSKTQPCGVSDIRWRIELRRRACPDYYAEFGVEVM